MSSIKGRKVSITHVPNKKKILSRNVYTKFQLDRCISVSAPNKLNC